MSFDDAAEGASVVGDVDDAGSGGRSAAGYPVTFEYGAPVQPSWLRLTIALVVGVAHAAALVALSNISPPAPPAEDTIEVNVIAAGDEAPVTASAARTARSAAEGQPDPKPLQTEARQEPADEPQSAEPAPPADKPPIAEQEPPPPPAPELLKSFDTPPPAATSPEAAPPPPSPDALPSPAAPPPVVATQDLASERLPAQQPPMSVEEMQPPPSPPAPDKVRTPPQSRPKAQVRLEPPERLKPHKPTEATSSTSTSTNRSETSPSRQGSAEAHNVVEESGRAVDVGMSRADYASLVIAQIEAHRFYPESARARGEQGAVRISFTIGPSGRVGSEAVVHSSGFVELDGAAREILRSISPPPPPGGSFSASTTIRFHFE
jgi:periplasmic protein TonB